MSRPILAAADVSTGEPAKKPAAALKGRPTSSRNWVFSLQQRLQAPIRIVDLAKSPLHVRPPLSITCEKCGLGKLEDAVQKLLSDL